MKVTRNDDGTVTVRIPKADEVYDQSTGELYIEETLPSKEFTAALPKAAPPKKPKPGK